MGARNGNYNNTFRTGTFAYAKPDVEVIEKIAHIFHFCGIAFLAVILIKVS